MARNVTDTTHLVVWPNKASTEGRYEWRNGTSISAPIVAGIVALMLQVDSTLTPETVVSILQKNAINDAFTGKISSPYDVRWGAGKVDALAAIEALGIPVSTPRAANLRAPDGGTVHAVIRGPNQLEVCGAGAGEKTVVEIFDTRGCMVAKIPAAGNRPVVLPGAISKGCFVLRVRYKGGVSAAQTFPRL
jgi:subtilisin family serine protease